MLIGIGVCLAVLLGVAFYGYQQLAGKIQTFDAAGVSAHRPADTGGQNILLIGTDSRAGASAKLGGRGDRVGRSDTTILVHIYPGSTSAVAVSIPRDSLVTIPPCRLPDGSWTRTQTHTMFNSAFTVGQTAAGNPACTQNTVEKLTGLRIDHTVVASFAGFAAMSQAVGGVPVCLPTDVYEGDLKPQMTSQGRLLFHAGMQRVEGQKALDYVRIRHGIGDGSDIGRIKRQQAFLSSLINTIRNRGLSPSHLLPLVNAATANLTFDPGLSSPRGLLSFALGLVHIKPADIDFLTVPWRYDGYHVAIMKRGAHELWAAMRNNQPLTGAKHTTGAAQTSPSPTSLPAGSGAVTVLNGTWKTGLAGRIADKLSAAGFTATADNAATRDYTRSEVHYQPADADRARLLARYIDARLVNDPSASTLTIYVGASHRWLALSGKGRSAQHKLPSSVTGNIRKADANPCSNLTVG